MLTAKQRLLNQLRGDELDRVPMVGGWNLGVRNLAALADLSVETYLADPLGGVIAANRRLGVDAIVPPIVPTDVESIRAGALEESRFADVQPEALLARAQAIPDRERDVVARFDAALAEQRYREAWEPLLARLRPAGIELLATAWEAPANFSLYFQYGYTAFLAAVALYPEAVARIYWEDGIIARERNKVLVRLMHEWELVPLLFCGHDICVNRGPLVAPAWLHTHYWPHVRVSLTPLLEAGIRVVHHCDGNVMPLVDDMLASGFTGFQGFQYECGVDPWELRARRGPGGEVPLLLGGLSVTRTLPFGTPAEVIEEVEYCLDVTEGGRGLFLFTSNVTGVEVPPANVLAAYAHLAAWRPRPRVLRERPRWPWAVRHPASVG